MIAEELEENINCLRLDAKRRGLNLITVEHLTLILILKNNAVRQMLVDSQADVQGLKQKLLDYLATRVALAKNYGSEPISSVGFKRVLKRVMSYKKENGNEINGMHVLATIFSEPESYAAYYMQKYGIERLHILHRLKQSGESTLLSREKSIKENMVDQALAGDLEIPVGREKEINAMIRTLSCRYKNNVLLVGEPGVGKTSVVHGLAHCLSSGEVPRLLQGVPLIPLSITDLVAGTRYRGDLEQRMKDFFDQCQSMKNVMIFIDEIHTLIGTGAVTSGSLDVANIIKPILNLSGIRFIGATTFTEYRRYFERDGALNRRFQVIEIRNPDDVILQTILSAVLERLSAHYGITYARECGKVVTDLVNQYFRSAALPDKAIEILDEAGAQRHLWGDLDTPIGSIDLSQAARRIARLPNHDRKRSAVIDLEKNLKERVFDQSEAATRLARAVIKDQVGLRGGTKTMGAFLFIGPTGVGKTEMAKCLASLLDMTLLRYDMSEYMEMHSISRLIGSPPGYVGFEQSGKLVEDIFRHPHAVLLLDEVEKAHSAILNLLLQMLDYGVITDNMGRQAFFDHAIIILTSNLGALEMERGVMGFERQESVALGVEATKRYLPPELRNRLDAIIPFHPLKSETIERIIKSELDEIKKWIWQQKGIKVKFSTEVNKMLKEKGVSPTMGARPLKRLLSEFILEPLALTELSGSIDMKEGIQVGWKNGKSEILSFHKKRKKEKINAAP